MSLPARSSTVCRETNKNKMVCDGAIHLEPQDRTTNQVEETGGCVCVYMCVLLMPRGARDGRFG